MAALSSIWNANGQTVGDALRFSDQNYYGTARSIAMGNAFTALGGDLALPTVPVLPTGLPAVPRTGVHPAVLHPTAVQAAALRTAGVRPVHPMVEAAGAAVVPTAEVPAGAVAEAHQPDDSLILFSPYRA